MQNPKIKRINYIKNILKSSFYQLLIVYVLLIFIISLGFLDKFALKFQVFALILAIIGIITINIKSNEQKHPSKPSHLSYSSTSSINSKINNKSNSLSTSHLHPPSRSINSLINSYPLFLIILSLIFILFIRYIPYINNNIPLGYDTGIYRYGIVYGLVNFDKWILSGGMEPGFLYLLKPLLFLFSIDFILIYLLIFFCAVLGLAIYFITKEFFNKNASLIALFIYSISIVQFKTFAYMYYKNILGLIFMLFSLYYLRKFEKSGFKSKKYLIIFIILASVLGSLHRPTFYIFGLSYFIYAFVSPLFSLNNNKNYDLKLLIINIIAGVLILTIATLFYVGKFSIAITSLFEPVLEGFVETGQAPGTFINFYSYQFLTLAYLPFALLGLFYLVRKKDFNYLFIWTIINGIIVYFQFFFFNRFIIHLDIALIILASLGFSVLIENKKKLGMIVLLLLIFSGGILIIKESIDSKPLINNNELNVIKQLQNTEPNSYIVSTSAKYSPWLIGYSNRKTIAPGLFDYNLNNKEEWKNLWNTNDTKLAETFFNKYKSEYNSPIYIFTGERQKDNLKDFSDCFNIYNQIDNNTIYKYVC